MTTQIKPPPPPPKTYISEAPKPPKRFFLWWLFKHPLVLISAIVHGVILATPVPLETKVEQPKIKDIPVTKTVSLKRTKVKPKSKTKPKPKPRIQRAPVTPRPLPVLPPSPKPPETEKPKPEQKTDSKDQTTEKQEPKDSESQSSESDPKKESDLNAKNQETDTPPAPPIENEEVETIFEELDQELINAEVESEFDYIPSPDEFPEPEKFFTTESIKAFDIVKNPNLTALGAIINSPRYYRLKEPDEVLASFPTIPAFKSASQPQKIGEYGGGPVYEFKVEDKTYYVNLVKSVKKLSKATFVIFWRADPNNLSNPEPGTS
ncbi:hypothetical protein [Acaryochloris sp. CCMEE 5410]|uniref:hypothetical protein n=1 Tax=Acaryochloris sp. CCMEE 5410 TaxID=310037 RepID=UPI0002484E64|nr:hypothetical protein [Acaryochloris sp. CCMEE 5410]KAI9130376.1 hypothetical protein ON05_021310 [Acaryochloris sp. CCMEE 5410]